MASRNGVGNGTRMFPQTHCPCGEALPLVKKNAARLSGKVQYHTSDCERKYSPKPVPAPKPELVPA